MKYALVEGEKSEATPKLKGTCSFCGSEMVAKCGRHKIWHWSHKSRAECDPWWESEGEWHRNWKNHFPEDWQEVIHIDASTGEKHIADVKSPYGLVIEFQNSNIKPEEKKSREDFYKEMIWVVNGSRDDLTEAYFNMGLNGPIQKNPLAYQISWLGRGKFMENWGDSKSKVYLDFGKDHVWRLVFFDAKKKVGAVGPLAKEAFISDCLKGKEISVSYIPESDESDWP
ncbi:competence protein CoiA [Vogesella perlucida]|nr:competence protein CoiA [Vogesella perlucida]